MKVRADKNAKAQIIGSLKNRTTVDVTEESDVWWKITYNDRDGYVQGKYLKEAPEVAAAPVEMEAEASGLLFGLTTTELIAIGVGLIVVIVLINRLSNYIARRRELANYKPPVVKAPTTNYWYQCKHCSVAIKKDTQPGIAGCSESLRHLWVNLGEVGSDKYMCKNCSTIIMVSLEPQAEGCPKGEHQWKKLEK